MGLTLRLRMVQSHQMLTMVQLQQLSFYCRELEEIVQGPQLVIKEQHHPGCPKCGVIAAFKLDNINYHCLACGHSFTDSQATVRSIYRVRRVGDEGFLEIPKLDIVRLKEKLSAVSPFITPVALFNSDRTLYVNILEQFGSLAQAFASIGIAYANPAKEHWQMTIIDFVGLLPDCRIAKIVGVSHTNIWLYRQRFGIPSAAQNFSDLPIDDESIAQIREFNNQQLQEKIEEFGRLNFRSVKKDVLAMVRENPTATDEAIRQKLLAMGVRLSRRTINKYRQDAGLEKKRKM